MVPIQRTLKKYSAGSNIFWELGYQDTPLFPGLIIIFVLKKYGLFKKARIPFIPASEHSLWKRKYGLF